MAAPDEEKTQLTGKLAGVVERTALDDLVAVVAECVGAARTSAPLVQVEARGIARDSCEEGPGVVGGRWGWRKRVPKAALDTASDEEFEDLSTTTAEAMQGAEPEIPEDLTLLRMVKKWR